MGVAVRLGVQVLSQIKSGRARKLLEMLADQLVGPRLEPHIEAVKPILLGGPATPIRVIPDVPLKVGDQVVSNPVPMVRDKVEQRYDNARLLLTEIENEVGET